VPSNLSLRPRTSSSVVVLTPPTKITTLFSFKKEVKKILGGANPEEALRSLIELVGRTDSSVRNQALYDLDLTEEVKEKLGGSRFAKFFTALTR
jgi:hypothetical protein